MTVPRAFPGLFHPGPALGVPPFRAFSLCRAAMPLGIRCPLDVHLVVARARPFLRCVGTSSTHSKHPRSHAGGQAPMGATPERSFARACSRSFPTIPRGIGTVLSRSLLRFGRTVAVRRTSAGSPSGLFSLQRARSSRPAVTPVRGRSPPGLRLSRARSHREGVGILFCRPPRSGFRDRVRSLLRINRRPPGGFPASMPGRFSLERRRPS